MKISINDRWPLKASFKASYTLYDVSQQKYYKNGNLHVHIQKHSYLLNKHV